MKRLISLLAIAAALGLAACGEDGDTTTVIEQAPEPAPQTVTETAPAPAPAAASKPAAASEPSGEPPDVVGMSLPEARRQLSAAGFRVDPTNTDTTFGIIVEENFTVCSQEAPQGRAVTVLAQKYGC